MMKIPIQRILNMRISKIFIRYEHFSFNIFWLVNSLFYNQKKMQEECISVIESQEFSTLKQILLRFPLMLEVFRAVDEDSLTQIVATISYARVSKTDGIVLQPKNIHLFFAAGRIYRRGRAEKSIRLKSKGNIRWGKETQAVNEVNGKQVAQFGHIEQVCGEQHYYPHSKTALLLYLDLERLPQSIVGRIREMRAQKVRFFPAIPSLSSLQRQAIEQNLHAFAYTEMKFGAIRQLSSNRQVLIIKSGSVEVGGKGLHGRTVGGVSVLGISQIEVEVKAISETVICYAVKTSILKSLLNKNTFSREQSPKELSFASAIASPIHLEANSFKENRLDKIQLNETLRAVTSLKKRTNHSSIDELSSLKKQRRLHLKKHFSNFYNQIFQEFSEKRARQLALTSPSEQKLVLYEIKLLQRKQPHMQEIKQRLRGIRLEKMHRTKVAIAGSSHIKELRNVGVGIE